MREILFKAKRMDNGEWIEGYLVIGRHEIDNTKEYAIIPVDVIFWEYGVSDMIQVIPETICQYTGLTDKNGNKIWENDVVKDKDICLLGSVEYDEEHGMYVINEVNDGYQNFQEFWSCTEVIGNIFENPELVERNRYDD